jgi:hypothetical protein
MKKEEVKAMIIVVMIIGLAIVSLMFLPDSATYVGKNEYYIKMISVFKAEFKTIEFIEYSHRGRTEYTAGIISKREEMAYFVVFVWISILLMILSDFLFTKQKEQRMRNFFSKIASGSACVSWYISGIIWFLITKDSSFPFVASLVDGYSPSKGFFVPVLITTFCTFLGVIPMFSLDVRSWKISYAFYLVATVYLVILYSYNLL